jgi:hypothetical protein
VTDALRADKDLAAAVALEESNLENLRRIAHKDTEGNIISMYKQ